MSKLRRQFLVDFTRSFGLNACSVQSSLAEQKEKAGKRISNRRENSLANLKGWRSIDFNYSGEAQIQLQGSALMKKETEPKSNKKLLLLKTLYKTIPLLQVFTEPELEEAQLKLHVFVFAKATTLAKDKEPIDYIGVIVEGRAVAPGHVYNVTHLIGVQYLLGLSDRHLFTITADTEGLMIAIRLEDLNKFNHSLRNRIILECAGDHARQKGQRIKWTQLKEQFQEIDEKKIGKSMSPQWSSFLGSLDNKQKMKFISHFPCLMAKQKDMIGHSYFPPYLIVVIAGRLVCKSKSEGQSYIEAGGMFNLDGFLMDYSPNCNVYCQSNEAIFMLIPRHTLATVSSGDTLQKIMQILCFENKKEERTEPQVSQDVLDKEWSLFKKFEVIPLAKKAEVKVKSKPSQLPSGSLNVFQTLFKEQLGPQAKAKTEKSMQKMYTMKSDGLETDVNTSLEVQLMKRQMESVRQKLRVAEESHRETKMRLIVSETKNRMNEVLRQIRKLHSEEGQGGKAERKESIGKVSLKEAFDNELQRKRVQALVGKCAAKWLQVVRDRKNKK